LAPFPNSTDLRPYTSGVISQSTKNVVDRDNSNTMFSTSSSFYA